MKHFIKKLSRTVSILSQLFCARMFGEYMYSGWNGEFEYSRYRWNGRVWIIPLSDVKSDY